MIEGESGLIEISPSWNRPKYIPSQRKLLWPNGAFGLVYTSEKPDQLRGPQHDTAWADEPCKWRYLEKTWDNLEMGMRIGINPQICATTTPRSVPWLKTLMGDDQCVQTGGSTYDNILNLPPSFVRRVVKKYEGTRLGQQELWAKVFEDDPNALWKRDFIDKYRLRHPGELPDLVHIAVGVDPQATTTDERSESGIVAAGLGIDGHAYVLSDDSLSGKPAKWGKAAVDAFKFWKGDMIIGEGNNGGDMVEHVINVVDTAVPFQMVYASRGKRTRAEPVAMMYEKGFVHHLGLLPDLEDQMCTWVPGEKSPDRMDALVWVLWYLLVARGDKQTGYIVHDERVNISPI